MIRTDIAIIGAGMAGASIAAEIGDAARVTLIEAEAHPGYHSTGRSAAFWSETYGGPKVQPLTTASEAYLQSGGFLRTRGELHIAPLDRSGALDAFAAEFRNAGVDLQRMDADRIAAVVPGISPVYRDALWEPTCRDIDVAALHAHYLKRAAQGGVMLMTDARIVGLQHDVGGWRIETRAGPVRADILVCAAGAWASEIARLAGASPIAITPYRRTVVQLQVDPPAPADLPLVMDIDGRFYFKPEAGGRIWLSPHDETPVTASDVAPEAIDVAVAIDRLEHVVDWRILRRERAWAGLRSFAPDRAPIYGHDPIRPGFFWFAGQGGFGIQTAPAAAKIGAALLLGRPLPDSVAMIDIDAYRPHRFAA